MYPVDGQGVNVMWELVPYDAGVPATEVFRLVGVYPERSGFSGDCGLVFVVSEGFEGVGQAWIYLVVWERLVSMSVWVP